MVRPPVEDGTVRLPIHVKPQHAATASLTWINEVIGKSDMSAAFKTQWNLMYQFYTQDIFADTEHAPLLEAEDLSDEELALLLNIGIIELAVENGLPWLIAPGHQSLVQTNLQPPP